jgi:hypothetical protein
MFNQEQTLSLLRTLLQIGGTALVTRGILTGAEWEAILAAILIIVPTVWGIWVRRNAGLVEAAAAVPNVQQIIADPKTVLKTASEKIVARSL